MKPNQVLKQAQLLLVLTSLLPVFAAHADIPYADKPLFYATGVKPNVALVLDTSSSMTAADTGGSGTITSRCNGATLTQPLSRMNAAKEAACSVVQDNAAGMRIGLYRFSTSSDYSGVLLNDFGATAPALKTSISASSANASGTPLAHVYRTAAEKYLGNSSPIQYRCQKNYVVFFTDGQPSVGIDTGNSMTLPSMSTQQSSSWANSSRSTGSTGGSPNWDGYPDPQQTWTYFATGTDYDFYPWMDDLAQLVYDVDIKDASSSGLSATLCGGTASAAGTDCSGKSWDDADFKQQNVVTYTVGLGVEANNAMMRDTPLTNQISIVDEAVNVGDDTLTIPAHGLKDGDFVHYYASIGNQSFSTTATANTGSDTLTGNTLNMANNDALTYSNGGGAHLQYQEITTPAVPGATCGSIGGLTSGNSYYVYDEGNTRFRLASSSSNAYSGSEINLTSTGTAGTIHSFTRTAASAGFDTTNSGSTPVNISTNIEKITRSNHGLSTGDLVTYTCSGSGCTIGGLTNGNNYYVARRSANEFRLANSAIQAVSCAGANDGSGTVGASCINLTSRGGSGREQTFTRAATSNVVTITATGSGSDPVDTGSNDRINTSSNHNFSTGDLVTYTCTDVPGTPAVYTTVNLPATVYARGVVAGNPGTFQVSLTSGGTPVDIVSAGTPAQTFAWTKPVAQTTIGGLEPYVTDDAPSVANPNYTTHTQAKGKYYVTRYTLDPENKIQLHECGGSQTLDADPGAAVFNITLYCTNGKAAAVDLTSKGFGTLSTGPGKSYFSLTTAELAASLKAAFTEIRALELSFGTLGANTSTEFTTGTRLYQARFDTSDWSGDVRAYKITTAGDIDPVPEWEASNLLPAPAARNIYTRNSGAGAFAFTAANYTSLTSVQQNSLKNITGTTTGTATDGQNVLNWVRGSNVAGYRVRNNGLLGDLLNSGLTYVGQPDSRYQIELPDSDPAKSTYNAFKGVTREPMIFGGSNGGMVHGFDASLTLAAGTERVAFIPEAVYMDWIDLDDDGFKDVGETAINKFYDVAQEYYGIVPGQDHHYFVNATPKAGDAYFGGSWHTVLVGGLGKGGRSVYALDVTDNTFTTADILWEFNDANSGDMGYSYSEPTIERLSDGQWVAIFGNGYDSRADQSRLYIVNIETGALIQEVLLGVAGNNGLSTVTVLRDEMDADNDGDKVEALTVYAGDLQGNVWKVDVSNAGSLPTSVMTPFFVAQDSSGNRQAITSAITLHRYPVVQSQGVMLFFGTGSYFSDNDLTYTGTPVYEAMYGIWDKGDVATVALTDLVEQQMGTVSLDPDGDGIFEAFRTATSNPIDYTGASPDRGWFMKMAVTTPTTVYQGERIVFTPAVTSADTAYVLFTTVIPADADPCVGGGSSKIYALDALSGGAKPYATFDLNHNNDFTDDDISVVGFEADGLASGVLVFDDGQGNIKVVANDEDLDAEGLGLPPGCVAGDPACAPPGLNSGRMSWRQLQ